MSEAQKLAMDTFVVTTKSKNESGELLTWEGVYNISMSCLKNPNFLDCYEPDVSESKALERINTKIRPNLLITMTGVSSDHLDRMLEKYYFHFTWKLKQSHLVRLRDLAIDSKISLRTAMAVDMDVRRRIATSDDLSNDMFISTMQGLKYLFFLYKHENITRGRWMLVGQECPRCLNCCNYNGTDFILQCGRCGNILKCGECGTVHVACKL